MANAVDRAVRAQGGAVVKPHQVRAMVLAARRAYKVQSELGLVDDGAGFDGWRRAALHDVVGAAAPSSFRAVTQRDYAAAIDYFEELAGGGRAEARRSDATRSDDEARRALWALSLAEGEAAGAFGGREGARRYADALFRDIHRTSRLVATARQVWAVIFTLRMRAKSRRAETRAKTAPGARGAAGGVIARADGSERFPAFSPAFSRV